jgi:hypothetical protein
MILQLLASPAAQDFLVSSIALALVHIVNSIARSIVFFIPLSLINCNYRIIFKVIFMQDVKTESKLGANPSIGMYKFR